jgi:hypothetical protein
MAEIEVGIEEDILLSAQRGHLALRIRCGNGPCQVLGD